MANDTNFRRDIVAGVKENFGKYLPVLELSFRPPCGWQRSARRTRTFSGMSRTGRAARAYGTLVKEVEGIGEKQRIRPADIAR